MEVDSPQESQDKGKEREVVPVAAKEVEMEVEPQVSKGKEREMDTIVDSVEESTKAKSTNTIVAPIEVAPKRKKGTSSIRKEKQRNFKMLEAKIGVALALDKGKFAFWLMYDRH